MKKRKGLYIALLLALYELRHEKGELLYRRVRPIVFQNHRNERVEKFLDKNNGATPRCYVYFVAEKYEKHGAFVNALLRQDCSESWKQLLTELKKLCFAKLQGKLTGPMLDEAAQEHATTAAVELTRMGYAFDDSWTGLKRHLVNFACGKGGRTATTGKSKFNAQAISADGDWLEVNLVKQADDVVQTIEKLLDLRQTILQNCTADEAVLLEQKYVYGKSDREIGEMLNCSQPKVWRMHRDLLDRLRGIL